MDGNAMEQERSYLQKTMETVNRELLQAHKDLKSDKGSYLSLMREYYEIASGSAVKVDGRAFEGNSDGESEGRLDADFSRLLELSSFVTYLYDRGAMLKNGARSVAELTRIADSPYFGHFDFDFGGGDTEQIYVGRHGVTDARENDMLVYDWRSPIAAVFYRHGLGAASYTAPSGEISGAVTLKRQIKTEKGKLVFAVDTDMYIQDELLAAELSHNGGGSMRDIVETIQEEQDRVIRDMHSDLLMVQGEAGSGKTSIALHRIAFLLYEQRDALSGKNIVVITPSESFGRYIETVLPSLGEERVPDADIRGLLEQHAGIKLPSKARTRWLERYYSGNSDEQDNMWAFLSSPDYVKLISNMARIAERHLIEFDDVWYAGQCVAHRADIKALFLENSARRPAKKRVERITERIMSSMRDSQTKYMEQIKKRVETLNRHPFDAQEFSESIFLRDRERLRSAISSIGADCFDISALYLRFFRDEKLFARASHGLNLPFADEVRRIISASGTAYGDSAGLLYLSLLLKGAAGTSDVRQVVIDEAQDYTPCFYAAMGALHPNARFTVVGDTGQTVVGAEWGEKPPEQDIYADIRRILNKKHPILMKLGKCYRSSREITRYARALRGMGDDGVSYSRDGDAVREERRADVHDMLTAARAQLDVWKSAGYSSVAVLAPDEDSAKLYANELGALFCDENADPTEGFVALPAFLAKGFEFEAVLTLGFSASDTTRRTTRLRYIAATRALHALCEISLG